MWFCSLFPDGIAVVGLEPLLNPLTLPLNDPLGCLSIRVAKRNIF
jgi:hypothetical protein